ncbi:MAG: 50S ribosomal protein L10 [Planctomycetaceae bacterium]|nr:50S ribosomal protein L10 [Planctomycetaceae bacterium]
MSKVVKRMMIDDLREKIGDRRDLLVLDTSKMDALSDNKLRMELRAKGITLCTVKNSLARVALREGDIETEGSVFAGPSVLAWGCEDVVALARELVSYAKKIEKFEIKGATVDGQLVDSKGVTAISKGPSRLELIGQISGLLLSPGAKLAGALLGPGGTIAGQLKAMSESEEGGDAA